MILELSTFIGYTIAHRDELYSGTDKEKSYKDNLNSLGHDWEYATTQVSYKRNSFGHRSKEFSELNLDNYILYVGCSFIEGIGIPVHARHSDVLASMLKCDMYNLGIGGSGNDAIFYNLITWLSTVKQKPKLIIIGWTSEHRFFKINQKYVRLYNPHDSKIHDFLASDNIGYFKGKTHIIKKLARNIITVPTIEIA